jgi:hypothetical protein
MGDMRLEPLVLSEAERKTLKNGPERRKLAQALGARIVLAGGPNVAVSARLGRQPSHRQEVGDPFLARRIWQAGPQSTPRELQRSGAGRR